MAKKKRIVAYNPVSDAFGLFAQLTSAPLTDVRGEQVSFDLGSYSHIVDDEELLVRINWIPETLINPEEIRRAHHRGMFFREVYINSIHAHEQAIGESFLVVVDRRPTLVFWTCILPLPHYLRNVKRGQLLWQAQ